MPREYEILSKLKGTKYCINLRNIFFTVSDSTDKVFMNFVFDYHPKNLHTFIRKQVLEAIEVKKIAFQLFKGIEEFHRLWIIHRDIKPENILLTKNKDIKICDFGCAKVYKNNQRSIPHAVSLYYRAPELCLGISKYNKGIDIWSAGCILMEMFMKFPIFKGKSDGD